MKYSRGYLGISMLAFAFAASLALGIPSRAQGTNPNMVVDKERQVDDMQQLKQRQLGDGSLGKPGEGAKLDSKEEAAYKAFFNASSKDPDKKIQLGQDFMQKYPSSRYAEGVYSGMAKAYYAKQDWNDLYSTSDKALAINPDDVDILAMVGWVIPHLVDKNTPGADQQFDKAEAYVKHVIQIMPTMPKPPGTTDEQFATAKFQKLSEAHSGLGLVYFRRGDFDGAAKEFELATQGNPNADPTDLFALGASLQNTGHFSEAVDAYTRCGEIVGNLQDQCKQNANSAKAQADQSKTR